MRILQHENAKLMKECKKITKFMPLRLPLYKVSQPPLAGSLVELRRLQMLGLRPWPSHASMRSPTRLKPLKKATWSGREAPKSAAVELNGAEKGQAQGDLAVNFYVAWPVQEEEPPPPEPAEEEEDSESKAFRK